MIERDNKTLTFIPNSDLDSWIAKEFFFETNQKKIEVNIILKSENETKINFFATNNRKIISKIITCLVKKAQNRCSLSFLPPQNGSVIIFIGGNGTWKKSDAAINLIELNIGNSVQKSIIKKINENRNKAFSFNENAFGAMALVLGIISTAIVSRYLAIVFIILMFIAGSSGVLFAFLISSIFAVFSWFFHINKQRICFRRVMVLLGFCIFLLTLFSAQTFNLSKRFSIKERVVIWHLVVSVWLESPRTFLIGVGDLQSAMKAKLTIHVNDSPITQYQITHAHSLWLQVAGEHGVIGLSIILWLWVYIVLKAWHSRDISALQLLVAIFIINFADYLFFYAPVHLAFWIAASGFKFSEKENFRKP